MSHYDTRDRKREKERMEQLKKQADPNQPTNVAKYQHQLAQNLLKEQHELNLGIHEKQAKLTREIYKKQSKLTIIAIIIAAFATVIAAIMGVYLQSKLESMSNTGQSILQREIQATNENLASEKGTTPHKQGSEN